MISMDTIILAASSQPVLSLVAQSSSTGGPVGPEFGKASPIGLLVLVLLGVGVLMAGWSFHRRYSRFRRRSLFAQSHNIDPFNEEELDQAMREAGIYDNRKRSRF